MNRNGSAEKSFVYGATLLAVSHVIIKIIGALFKIPLDTMILHTEGMGIYNSAYTIYNWLYVISTAGIPIAISKLVSEAIAKGRKTEADAILLVSMRSFALIGALLSVMLFFGAPYLAGLLNAPSAENALRALSPAILFVALVSVFRGYSQGHNDMLPTALSEIAEALGKLVAGLGFGYLFLSLYPDEIKYSAAGAIGGVSTGTFFALLILVISHFIFKKKNKYKRTEKSEFSKVLLKNIITIALPITLSASVFTMTAVIDTALNMNLLGTIGIDEAQRLSLTGYLGRAVTMFNVAPTVVAAIAVSIVPVISGALAKGDKKEAASTAISALRITSIFVVPCAVGLGVLAEPVLGVIYNDSQYFNLLTVMGLAVMFVGMVQIENAVLQSYSNVWKPVINMAIGAVAKIACNIVLVTNPKIGIYGAPVGTLVCYMIIMLLNYRCVKKEAEEKMKLSGIMGKPIICSVLMAFVAKLCYNLICGYSDIIALALSVMLGALTYFTLMFGLRGIKKEDVILFPGGEKLLKTGILKGTGEK